MIIDSCLKYSSHILVRKENVFYVYRLSDQYEKLGPNQAFFLTKAKQNSISERERKGEASRLRREEVLPFYCPIERVLEANMINGSICMSFHRFQNGNSVPCMYSSRCYTKYIPFVFPSLTKSIESYYNCSKFCQCNPQIR